MNSILKTCIPFCEVHGREFIGVHNRLEYCLECAADGYSSELCHPCPDSCFSLTGIPHKVDEFEMGFMCEKHKKSKLKFITELNEEFK